MKSSKVAVKPVLLRALGSVWFAVTLIAGLAVLLAVSTWIESTRGTPFAQRLVYRAGWFDLFLSLLAVNIVCSTLLRLPFKKKHAGFVITHIGILALLIGSLLTRLAGVEGQVLLPEGAQDGRMFMNEFELAIEGHADDETMAAPLFKPGPGGRHVADLNGYELRILRLEDEALATENVSEGGPDAPENPALYVRFRGQTMGVDESFWVVRRHPDHADGDRVSIGPATIALADARPAVPGSKPTLKILKAGSPLLELPLTADPARAASMPLGNSALKIENFSYFPNARVNEAGTGLVTLGDDPTNPAVAFTVTDGKTQRRYVKFALFPDFDSMHGRGGEDPFGLTVQISGAASASRGGAALTFFRENGRWFYESRSKTGEIKASGAVEPGVEQAAGWVDFKFTVLESLERAVIETSVKPAPGGQAGPGAQIELLKDGQSLLRAWVVGDRAVSLPVKPHTRVVFLRQKTQPLPFELALKDFRKVDYPGTRRPAAFESDVVLTDSREKTEIHKTVSMNKPLDYAGFRIFQSSYIQDGSGETSIFTVAKNPGIGLIYGGSIVLFFGAFVVFFVPAYSSFKF